MKIWVLRFRNKMLIECYDLFPVLPALLKILLASEYLPIPLHPTFLLQLLPPVHLLEHHLVKEGGVVPHQQWHHQEPHLQYGAHHGAGGCVADEHGYETGDCHKAGGGGNQTFSYSMASLLREGSLLLPKQMNLFSCWKRLLTPSPPFVALAALYLPLVLNLKL